MAIVRVSTNGIADDAVNASKFDETDNYTFTGTVEGAGGGIFESQLLHLRDEKAQNTNGGASVVGTQTRTLNTVKTNEITGASLSSNQITLPSGTYYINAIMPAVNLGKTQAYLYSVTDGSNEIIGMSLNSRYGEPGPNVSGRFTTATTRVYEIRQYTESVNSSGLGAQANQTTEVYTDVKIWKVA